MQKQLRNYDTNIFQPNSSVQIVIEAGTYDLQQSKICLSHTTVQTAAQTLIYNTQYTDFIDNCSIFIDNHLQLQVKKLSQLQRDNYFAENNYMNNKQNLYHGSNTDASTFQNLQFLDIQPSIVGQENKKINVYDFDKFFPMTSQRYIVVEQQLIIKMDINATTYCSFSINNTNANATNNIIAFVNDNGNRQIKFQMVQVLNQTKQQNQQNQQKIKQQVIQQEFTQNDINYFIQCLQNQYIYSLIFSFLQTGQNQIVIGDSNIVQVLSIFIDQQQIIYAQSVDDVKMQFQQYKNNLAPILNLNLKEQISQPLNIFLNKNAGTCYITYYKNIID